MFKLRFDRYINALRVGGRFAVDIWLSLDTALLPRLLLVLTVELTCTPHLTQNLKFSLRRLPHELQNMALQASKSYRNSRTKR